MNRPVVNVIPIGEADTDLVRSEVTAITASFDRIGADLSVAGPAGDEAAACQAVQRLAERNPDLLLSIPLRGLSAPIIEKAAQSSAAPCLIWPVQGRYALPSSALAAGALRDSGIPVELFYAPPGLPELDRQDRLPDPGRDRLFADPEKPHRGDRGPIPEPGVVPLRPPHRPLQAWGYPGAHLLRRSARIDSKHVQERRS